MEFGCFGTGSAYKSLHLSLRVNVSSILRSDTNVFAATYESHEGICGFSKKIHTSKSIYRIVGLRIRFHGLSNRSLELDNSFFRIVYRSLELDNPLYRIANRSLYLNTAIRENGLYNSR